MRCRACYLSAPARQEDQGPVLRIATAVMLTLALAACAGDGRLHRLDSGSRVPDDFSVLPAQPLVIPDALSLPEPGGTNLADPNPLGQAMALLGGTQGAGVAGNAALIAQVTRHGITPDIRALVSQEDADFRRRAARGGFSILGRDRYYPAYSRMNLDPWAELERFRAAGVATPSAPPRR